MRATLVALIWRPHHPNLVTHPPTYFLATSVACYRLLFAYIYLFRPDNCLFLSAHNGSFKHKNLTCLIFTCFIRQIRQTQINEVLSNALPIHNAQRRPKPNPSGLSAGDACDPTLPSPNPIFRPDNPVPNPDNPVFSPVIFGSRRIIEQKISQPCYSPCYIRVIRALSSPIQVRALHQ
jgi:hypothetical protein